MIPVVIVAAFSASFVQSVAGFGFALLAMPIMATAFDPKVAVVVTTMLAIASAGSIAVQERAHADRVLVRRLVLSALLGMPLGFALFVAVDTRILRVVLGVAVLAAVAVLAREAEVAHVSRSVDVTLGVVSGVLSTSLSTNGPPLVVDLQARRLPPERFRATLTSVLALTGVVSLAIFATAGRVDRTVLSGVAVGLPALGAGFLAGRAARPRLDPAVFRLVVLVLLTLAAASSLVAGVRG